MGKMNIGRICNPSIRELVEMIWEFVRSEQQRDSSLTWNDFTLGKMDLKSAFNLLNFQPADVRLLAAALTDELTIFSLVGVFGYTLLPAYFDHIPKALLRLLQPRIRAAADMFIDDFMAITIKQEWPTVAAEVRTVCESLLGSKAISSDKTRQGAVLDFIGWEIDLPQQRVSIAHHCFLKAVYLYFEVDVDHPVPLRQMQQLGSLASRYSEVCTVMRPYTAALWHCTRGITNPSTRGKLTPMAKRAIWLWRCMLCLHKWDRYTFSRSIDCFIVPLCPRFRCCFDASLMYEVASGNM